jgi:aliphatic nitrilase
MSDVYPVVKVAAVQAASVFLDRNGSTDKACGLIREAGRNGAQLIGFPEGFIPAHPVWYYHFSALAAGAVERARRLFHNSVEIPSDSTDALCAAAAEAQVNVVIGICQREQGTAGTMWNSQLFIDRDGKIVGVHQKLVPTIGERLVHAPGSGAGMRAFPMDIGVVGGLICGENSNPLAISKLLLDQARVHVASWPNYFVPEWKSNMGETSIIAGRAIAYMLKCFVINACGTIAAEDADAMATTEEHRAYLADPANLGGSNIISPSGDLLAGPAGPGDEIIYADADLDEIVTGKLVHDFAGHYQRFDVFEFATHGSDPHRRAGTGAEGDAAVSMTGEGPAAGSPAESGHGADPDPIA